MEGDVSMAYRRHGSLYYTVISLRDNE